MNLFSFIKQHCQILEVVSTYTTLKKAGHYYKGTCPFHHERTASFTVTPHKEIFYCFGCHVGGDVISFIAKTENCSAIEAARHLVDQYALTLPKDISFDKKTESFEVKKQYYKTCELFAKWCHSLLAKNDNARNYLLDREITLESIQAFNLGYCSSDVKKLLTYAQKDNILAQNLIDAHILKEGKMGLYIAFDERIIFPIRDHLGNYVGFGGRVFKKDDERAKYYNSSDHPYFNKGKILFGLNKAKKSISQKEAVFLVEGYTDLIVLNQFGYTNTVATLGTACTLDHLQHLARHAQKLFIMYDGDAAGQKAIMRLVELCWQVSVDPYVITLPKEDDPASYVLQHKTLEEPLSKAQDIFSFVINHLSDDFSGKSLQGKLAVTKRILELIGALKDPLKQDLLLQQASVSFGVPYDTLKDTLKRSLQKVQRAKRPTKPQEPQEPTYKPLLLRTTTLEKKLFSVILNHKGALAEDDQELLGLLLDEQLQKVFSAWCTAQNDEGTDITTLFEQVSEDEKAFISHCLSVGETEETMHPAHLTQLYKKQWKKRVHLVKLQISDAEQHGNKDQVAQLLTDLTALKNKMLKRGI